MTTFNFVQVLVLCSTVYSYTSISSLQSETDLTLLYTYVLLCIKTCDQLRVTFKSFPHVLHVRAALFMIFDRGREGVFREKSSTKQITSARREEAYDKAAVARPSLSL